MKHYLAGVFIDLSKAFDSLSHEVILYKLNNFSISGIPLKLFKSYLTNRYQAVYCNSTYSSYKPINKGVPQRSILGPIIFIMYINDIVNASHKFEYTIYADDTSLLLHDTNMDSLHLNIELQVMNYWIKHNKLRLNVSKTNYIFIQNHSIKFVMPPVTIERITLNKVDRIKFLAKILIGIIR